MLLISADSEVIQSYIYIYSFSCFLNLYLYLFLAVLGLRCYMQAFV